MDRYNNDTTFRNVPDRVKISFRRNLYELMQKNNVDSCKLAKSVGVHVSDVTNWLNGSIPTLEQLGSLSALFNVSVGELLKVVRSMNGDNNEPKKKKLSERLTDFLDWILFDNDVSSSVIYWMMDHEILVTFVSSIIGSLIGVWLAFCVLIPLIVQR